MPGLCLIYGLDNSFNMNINGVDLATSEIEFQSSGTPAPGINIRFVDGDEYEVDTEGTIWQMAGTEENPLIRVEIAANGDVSMFGSKVSGGPLFPLALFNGNAFNTITWNPNDPNSVTVSQNVVGLTRMEGKGYGLSIIDNPIITVLTTTDPTCENGESLNNGTIEFTVEGLVDGTYDFQYDGGTLEGVVVVDGTAIASELFAGEYNNITVGIGEDCISAQGVNAVLIDPCSISCIEVIPGGEWNQSFTRAQVAQMDPKIINTYDPITVAGTNAGMFFDIYRLDNSFTLKINGDPIVTDGTSNEMQFDVGNIDVARMNNIRFLDGDLYNVDVDPIWKIIGTAANPAVRE